MGYFLRSSRLAPSSPPSHHGRRWRSGCVHSCLAPPFSPSSARSQEKTPAPPAPGLGEAMTLTRWTMRPPQRLLRYSTASRSARQTGSVEIFLFRMRQCRGTQFFPGLRTVVSPTGSLFCQLLCPCLQGAGFPVQPCLHLCQFFFLPFLHIREFQTGIALTAAPSP